MSEICMANCMATKIYLQLRNKIFYYRVELPRVNNKRRYKIISLHTQNYFEAQEKIKQIKETALSVFSFDRITRLDNSKNASEHLAPIHKQLLDLGFVNYLNT